MISQHTSRRKHSTMKEAQYLFIDGGCLRTILKIVSDEFFSGNDVDIDFSNLASGFKKTFYYDAYQPQKREEAAQDYEARIKPQTDFFNKISLIPGFHVFVGTTHRRRKTIQQKKVDVKLAVDMLTHSIMGNMDKVTLLTGDLDFKPLIDALVQNGMYVTLWYPGNRTTNELIFSADYAKPLNIQALYNSTTNHFKKNFSIPKTFSRQGKNVSQLDLIERWIVKSEFEVELYEKDNNYLIIFPNPDHSGYYTYAEYDDIELLKLFVRDTFYTFDWREAS